MAEFSNSDVRRDAAVESPRAADVPEPAKQSKWYRWRKDGTALASYLLDSEVHTFAFSVAANAILSFIPFIVLLYTLAESVFHHSTMMVKVINDMVNYFLPSNQDFVARNLALVASGHGAAVLLADHDSGGLHGNLSSPGGGAEPGLGRDQEPQLPAQSDHRLWVGDPDGGAGHERASW